VTALVYVSDAAHYRAGPPWSLADWVARHGTLALEAAGEFMALWPATPPERAAALFPQIQQRAASRLRAAADPAPVRLRRGGPASAIEVAARRRPYSGYFALEEWDLSFPTFAGGRSERVTRAAFVSGDAVTVLPYDPVRDRVLLVEQFRFGPLRRGDPNPWSLEPVAGRIDAGETPAEAARREAAEEAGLALGELIPVGRYYPSPGAVAEYLYTFIGLADLPDAAARAGGLAEEHEDIRGLLLGFDELMALVDGGEAENGPLLVSALQLARLRPSLRK
jgi:nudix-type nucleoside diphosphatase (YffH/AdpP family)